MSRIVIVVLVLHSHKPLILLCRNYYFRVIILME
jgi:hypothetical protein